MIPGGGGDGGSYSLVVDILSDEFKVITDDRRANARSSMNEPNHFDIAQQSRDAVAVIHAAGEKLAFVFGNSSGAVIALDMAATQSQGVRAIIAHEPPLSRIHPDSEKWEKFFEEVYRTANRFGPVVAMLKFTLGIGVDLSFGNAFKAAKAMREYRKKSGQVYLDRKITMEYFVKQELVPITNYVPDVKAIQKNGVKIYMAARDRSLEKKRFYAEAAQVMAKKLDCEMVVFPGHHGSFADMPNEWAEILRETLRKAA